MILRLSIEGLALIESLTIDFARGFNVITGETGAGKSILIRALNFLMGGKTSADMVRTGYTQGVVWGEFEVPKTHPSVMMLENLGIPLEETPRLLIRRQLTAKGRSQAWLNDIPVTSPTLREVGSQLVDIFSQHENQKLMDDHSHLDYLDRFLKDRGPKHQAKRLYQEMQEQVKGIQAQISQYESSQKSKDYLQFRLEEFDKFGPEAKEFSELEEFTKVAGKGADLKTRYEAALSALEAVEFGEVVRVLKEVEAAESLVARLKAMQEELSDINYELNRLVSSQEVSEEELRTAEERLDTYHQLFRKFGVRLIDDLIAEGEKVRAQLQVLEKAEAFFGEAIAKLEGYQKELAVISEKLNKERSSAAVTLRKAIQSELKELAMAGTQFEVRMEASLRTMPDLDLSAASPALQARWNQVQTKLAEFHEWGRERAFFFLSTNPGEPFLPLADVVSGGELSRMMLALKKILISEAETCVLVFDEIDTGISGKVADVVGKKLKELSRNFQVVCISHLPQVAVHADAHFLVSKSESKKRTESSILKLTAEESAKEIARLLSGEEISKSSLENAKALIAKAKQNAKFRQKELR